MKKNNKWFALIISMILIIFISLLAISILDHIIPFSKNTKNIENSIWAYYQANSWIENALLAIKWQEPWFEQATILSNLAISNNFSIMWTWTRIPTINKWNSEFDQNWNKIRLGEPIQLEIWKNMIDPNNTDFYFRVPNLDNDNTSTETLSWWNIPIINWQLTSQDNILNATWSYIRASDICNSKDLCSEIDFSEKQWIDLNEDFGINQKFINYYLNNCNDITKKCSLKLSIVNELKTIHDVNIPYIEWYIDFGLKNVPLRYAVIKSQWKSYGFKKDLKARVPQQSVSEAFDFTIFQ